MQKCFYESDIETRKKLKSQEEIELNFVIKQKQVKAKLLAENADIWWLRKNVMSNPESLYCFFECFSVISFGCQVSSQQTAVLYVEKIWCSFYKVIGNWGFISYSRFNLLGKAIKTFL